jgi:hypothetical protein
MEGREGISDQNGFLVGQGVWWSDAISRRDQEETERLCDRLRRRPVKDHWGICGYCGKPWRHDGSYSYRRRLYCSTWCQARINVIRRNARRRYERREWSRDVGLSDRICLALQDDPWISLRLLVELTGGKRRSVATRLTALVSKGLIGSNGALTNRLYRLTAQGAKHCCRIRDRSCPDGGMV